MARTRSQHPTELELEILKILWDEAPLPVREVRARLESLAVDAPSGNRFSPDDTSATIIGNLGGCVVRDGSRADAVAINVSNRSRQSTRRAGARFD